MDIWNVDKLIIFIYFFVPGFISIKVYDLFVPRKEIDTSRMVVDAISFSCINYALFSWLFFLDNLSAFYEIICLLIILFISPICLALLYWKVQYLKYFKKYFRHPIPMPWDYVFGKKIAYWIIIELKDGTRIGGEYDSESFTSSYPKIEQIYLQKVWKIEERNFIEPIERSSGILISGENIKYIEFFN